MTRKQTDVVIIGSGIAGLAAARQLSSHFNVMLLTKSTLGVGNSEKAQGGIAAPIHVSDTEAAHVHDTLRAGDFYNDQKQVHRVIDRANEVIHWLEDRGIAFDKEKGRYHLGREGAHRYRRILHAGGDATGKQMMQSLKHDIQDRVTIKENFLAYELIVKNNRCYGVIGKNEENNWETITAPYVILATGGCGGVYSINSNSPETNGDGMAMAYRAGAQLKDMEFVQFHPTLLVRNGKGKGLLSEAIRGEGGYLVNQRGERIMEGIHPDEDLAPRPVVSKVIYDQIQNGNRVYLHVKNVHNFKERFPSITNQCHQVGVDLEEGLLPVSPGAHFMMGGVSVNEYGKTSVQGLYAIGETACSGLHGANRLASNSLLEGVVSALTTSEYLLRQPLTTSMLSDDKKLPDHISIKVPSIHVDDVKNKMDKYVGIIRNEEGLNHMKAWLKEYTDFIFEPSTQLNKEEMSLKNVMTIAWMITCSALIRKETRGAHIRNDFSTSNDETWLKRTIYWEKDYFPHVKNRNMSTLSAQGKETLV